MNPGKREVGERIGLTASLLRRKTLVERPFVVDLLVRSGAVQQTDAARHA